MDPRHTRIPAAAQHASDRFAALKHIAIAFGATPLTCDLFIATVRNLQPLTTTLCAGCHRHHATLTNRTCSWLLRNGQAGPTFASIQRNNRRRLLCYKFVSDTLAGKQLLKADLCLSMHLDAQQLNYMMRRCNLTIAAQHAFADAVLINQLRPLAAWFKATTTGNAILYIMDTLAIEFTRANKLFMYLVNM